MSESQLSMAGAMVGSANVGLSVHGSEPAALLAWLRATAGRINGMVASRLLDGFSLVTFETAPPRGTTFRVRLPLTAANDRAPANSRPGTSAGGQAARPGAKPANGGAA